jgi:hypothetical protein
MSTAVYEQATGLFIIVQPLPVRTFGYAGRGAGRNNPAMQHVRNVGPLPAGVYKISRPFLHARMGPMTFRLTPDPDNVMHHRSGFLIHGDNNIGDASSGCIILPRPARDLLDRSGVRTLTVFRTLPTVQCN